MQLTRSASAVAWYGAIMATLSLAISGYVAWRDRARIKATARSGQRLVTPGVPAGHDGEKRYVVITVANVGRRPITVSTAGLKMRGDADLWFSEVHGQEELLEGTSCCFLGDEAQITLDDIMYPFVHDAVGRTYKGRFIRR